MKKYTFIPVVVAAFALFSCSEPAYINGPGNNDNNLDTIPVVVDPDPTPDPEGFTVPEATLTVNEAVNIAKKLKPGEVSEKKYFIKGWVTSFNRNESFNTDFPKYGNDFVYLSSREDGEGTKT